MKLSELRVVLEGQSVTAAAMKSTYGASHKSSIDPLSDRQRGFAGNKQGLKKEIGSAVGAKLHKKMPLPDQQKS